MAKDKLKNCFIDEAADYTYDISTEDGEYLATARSLSPLDTSAIQKHSFSLVRDEKGEPMMGAKGLPQYDINVHLWELYTILRAVTKWKWDREITLDNIALLKEELRHTIFREIRRHEGFFNENKEAIEKN